MTARLESEQRGELLLVRLRGSIGFDEPDHRLRDELVSLLRRHLSDVGTQLLVDFSGASFVFGASLELGALPLAQKDVVGTSRVAVVLGANERARKRFRATGLDRVLDCFETEAEAVVFLRSGAAMTNGAALDHEFWEKLGPEVGPEPCSRAQCGRLRVEHSLFCKRHHDEMVRGAAYVRQTDV